MECENSEMETQAANERRQRNRQEKLVERENRNNLQQIYLSSPVKSCDKVTESDMAGTFQNN